MPVGANTVGQYDRCQLHWRAAPIHPVIKFDQIEHCGATGRTLRINPRSIMRPGGGIQMTTDATTIGTGAPGDWKTNIGLNTVIAPVSAIDISSIS